MSVATQGSIVGVGDRGTTVPVGSRNGEWVGRGLADGIEGEFSIVLQPERVKQKDKPRNKISFFIALKRWLAGIQSACRNETALETPGLFPASDQESNLKRWGNNFQMATIKGISLATMRQVYWELIEQNIK